jgi:tRNA nucleotidyltransferase/poly(A) polymerase
MGKSGAYIEYVSTLNRFATPPWALKLLLRQVLKTTRNHLHPMIQINSNIFPKIKGAYIVGGSIRDLLLGRTPTDYDIAVTGNPEKFAKEMLAKTAGHYVEMGKPGKKIIRVISGNNIFDITPLNRKSIEENLNKRDFTINAMAYVLNSGEIIDVAAGLRDLADKKVRMVSKDVFKKDPIRLIRAYRMGACLDFDIDSQTASAIHVDAERIKTSAGERIRAELFKMFGAPNSYDYLSQMADTGLLYAIFPDLGRLIGCFQNTHHQYDVFEHTMKSYNHLEIILNDPETSLPESASQIRKITDETSAALLKCSILLHDIGKPLVKTIDNRGNTHFYGHAQKSADMAQKISKQLKFSNNEKRFIDAIVRNHIKPLFLFSAHKKKTLTRKGSTRFFIKYGNITPHLLLHAIADIMAKQKNINKTNEAFLEFLKEMIHDFFYRLKPKIKQPPLVNGHDLIHRFNLTPSPLFKTILKQVNEARLTNQVQTRSEALALVRKLLNNRI